MSFHADGFLVWAGIWGDTNIGSLLSSVVDDRKLEYVFNKMAVMQSYYINKNGFMFKDVYFSYAWKHMGHPVKCHHN